MSEQAGFVGVGLAFGLRPDRGGGLAYVGGADNVEQSLLLLLRTVPGERVMRPTFGCSARDLVLAPGSVRSLRLLETAVRDAVRDWEPRVDVEAVTAALDPRDPATATVDLHYRVRRTNTPGNLVFPYHLPTAGGRP